MGLFDFAKDFLSLAAVQQPPAMHERDSGFEEALVDVFSRRFAPGTNYQPWRKPTTREAMGVPAIFRAVTLISTMTGMMALEAYQRGRRLEDDERPALIKRPDPFRTPRDFYVDTAYGIARYGESWWWIAKRDPSRTTTAHPNGAPLSLLVVPSNEITMEENRRNELRPIIRWRDTEMPNDDMRQIVFMKEPGHLRGFGPLQMCGAATSVSVESQEWAANFFAEGGYPNLVVKAAGSLSSDPEDEDGTGGGEIQRLEQQWTSKGHNLPRFVDQETESVTAMPVDPQGAQMLAGREYQNGDAARMFGIPGSMLEYGTPGSSLTYQNIEQEFTKFVETCLQPGYLEAIEQTMSDLLPSSTVARFNVDALRRADVKTRFEVYEKSVGVFGEDVAREWAMQREGLIPGDVENDPVPFAPPRAIPTSLPVRERSLEDVVCGNCGRKNGEAAGPYRIACKRCGQMIVAA